MTFSAVDRSPRFQPRLNRQRPAHTYSQSFPPPGPSPTTSPVPQNQPLMKTRKPRKILIWSFQTLSLSYIPQFQPRATLPDDVPRRLNDDIVLFILSLSPLPAATAMMATCHFLYHEGAKIILRDTPMSFDEGSSEKKVLSLLRFIQAEHGSRCSHIRTLHVMMTSMPDEGFDTAHSTNGISQGPLRRHQKRPQVPSRPSPRLFLPQNPREPPSSESWRALPRAPHNHPVPTCRSRDLLHLQARRWPSDVFQGRTPPLVVLLKHSAPTRRSSWAVSSTATSSSSSSVPRTSPTHRDTCTPSSRLARLRRPHPCPVHQSLPQPCTPLPQMPGTRSLD